MGGPDLVTKPVSCQKPSPVLCVTKDPLPAPEPAQKGRPRGARKPVQEAPKVEGVRISDIQTGSISWENYCLYKGLSPETIRVRKLVISKLVWWMQENRIAYCDRQSLMLWVGYLRPLRPAGRWGNAEKTKATRPRTAVTYFNILRSFFNFLVKEGAIDKSPCEGLDVPKAGQDQVRPFTDGDVRKLLDAAKKSNCRYRDTAIVALLCETGIRVSELTGIVRRDVDLSQHQVTVLGKGDKRRTVPFGLETKQALTRLVIDERPDDNEPVFVSSGGRTAGQAMTRSGILQTLEKLGKVAGIEGVRCSPHTCRHYAAVTYITAGADAFFVQALLGHTSPRQTSRYVNLGSAAMAEKARKYSPMDTLKKKARIGR